MKKILFVCTGNTCRSPMAESILKSKLREKEIKNVRCASAGIFAEVGEPMSEHAKKAMKTMGVRCRPAKSKQVTAELLKKHNLVLCMTQSHKNALSGAGHKNVFTLAELTKTHDISDPFGGNVEVYLATARELEKAIDILLEIIL